MANSEAVAHTPQPHIGAAYVGIKCSISTMYRGAVPITEYQSADVFGETVSKVEKLIFDPRLRHPDLPEASLGATGILVVD